MVVAQRGTAAVTGSGSAQFPVDRWQVYNSPGTVTFQQSSIAPVGFSNSMVATVTSTGSYGTTGYTQIGQYIEGYNVADLAWGTANAKPITLSFWVRASITGSYNVALQNGGATRSYVTTFSVNATNTWEYKIIYVNGDTTGTWATDNTTGMRVWFNIGMGTNYDTTANTWVAGAFYSTSGTVDFFANSGATFYLTGVQLEQNYQPTPFEQRPFGIELQLCQRYYEQSYPPSTAPGTNTSNGMVVASGSTDGSGYLYNLIPMNVQKRAVVPVGSSNSSFVRIWSQAGTVDQAGYNRNGASNLTATCGVNNGGIGYWVFYIQTGAAWVPAYSVFHWVYNCEL